MAPPAELAELDRQARLQTARLLLRRLRHPEWRAALSIALEPSGERTPRSAGIHVALLHTPLGPLVEAVAHGDEVGVLVCLRSEDPRASGLAIVEVRTAWDTAELGVEPGEHSLEATASLADLLALSAHAPAPVRVEVRVTQRRSCVGVCLVLDDGVEPHL